MTHARLWMVMLVCTWSGVANANHRNWPDLPKHTYHGKPLRVVSVVADNNPSLSDLQKFTNDLVKSTWYSDLGKVYQWGSSGTAHNWTVKESDFIAGATNSKLSQFLHGLAQTHKLASDDKVRTIYTLFLPKKALDNLAPSPPSGGWGCGAGNHFPKLDTTLGSPFHPGDAIALVNSCSGSTDLASLDAQTVTASHEIAESGTDTPDSNETDGGFFIHNPPSDSPWVSGNKDNQETGDMCGGTHTKMSGFAVQRIYDGVSNGQGKAPCIPADSPYFSVSTEHDWYEVASGQSIDINVTGWSTAHVADWKLTATNQFCSGPATTLSLSHDQINDGVTRKLTVHALNWSGSDHCVVELDSILSGDPDTGGHQWRIGIKPTPTTGCPKDRPYECRCPTPPGHVATPPFCTTPTACEHACGGNIPGHR